MLSFSQILIIAAAAMSMSQAQVQAQSNDERFYLPNAILPSQQGLARLFFSSRLMQTDHRKSAACFKDYTDEGDELNQIYGRDHNECLAKASESRNQIDAEAFRERSKIERSAKSICSTIEKCNGQNVALDMFNCHANEGSNNTKLAYELSDIAANNAMLLQERYRLIELQLKQCFNAVKHAYVVRSSRNYDYLQDCLFGGGMARPIKATTTTTTTMTTMTAPTAVPTAATPTTVTDATTSTQPPTTTTTTTTTSTQPPPTSTTEATTDETTTTTMEPETEAPMALIKAETSLRFPQQFKQFLNFLN